MKRKDFETGGVYTTSFNKTSKVSVPTALEIAKGADLDVTSLLFGETVQTRVDNGVPRGYLKDTDVTLQKLEGLLKKNVDSVEITENTDLKVPKTENDALALFNTDKNLSPEHILYEADKAIAQVSAFVRNNMKNVKIELEESFMQVIEESIATMAERGIVYSVKDKVRDAARMILDLQHEGTIAGLYTLLKLSPETFSHDIRMAAESGLLAENLGYSEVDQLCLIFAGALHDLGKTISPDVSKEGKLTSVEKAIMKLHPEVGYKFLTHNRKKEEISQEEEIAALVALHHHNFGEEAYGGHGEKPPMAAVIAWIADMFDALTTPRSYKDAYSIGRSLMIIKEQLSEPAHKKVYQALFETKVLPKIKAGEQVFLKGEEIHLPKSFTDSDDFINSVKDYNSAYRYSVKVEQIRDFGVFGSVFAEDSATKQKQFIMRAPISFKNDVCFTESELKEINAYELPSDLTQVPEVI
jgi:putative nucleotidyltransferase with HDIG domain